MASSGKPIVIDLFAGAGGESEGIRQAFEACDLKYEMYAVNHWELALETHGLNHPSAFHYCEDVFKGTAARHIGSRRVALLWASPSCVHFSAARGGGPCNPQDRAGIESVLQWCRDLTVDRVIVENVKELLTYGELDSGGVPIPERKGKLFELWVANMRSLGYTVDWRLLCAADYGAPTSRTRLFLQAVRNGSGKQIVWPAPTHTREQWLPAACVIDWRDLGTPLSQRKKPLADKTLARIARGIERYWGEYAEPYMIILRGTSNTRDIHSPLPTITAGGGHLGLICPIDNGSTKGGCLPVGVPLTTITTKQRHAVAVPLVMGQHSGSMARPASSSPVPTITTVPYVQVITPLVASFYGNGGCSPVTGPLPTVTTKARFGLVCPRNIDIGFRMLSVSELSKAQGFSADYRFAGNKTEITKQIGNAVPPAFAYHQVKHYAKELAA